MSPTPNSFAGAECYKGSDINGAQFYVALPGKWNNSYESLVIYAPGGPGPTSAGSHSIEADALAGLFGSFLPHRVAVAVTAYSRQGWAVGTNAQDIDNLRVLFTRNFGRPAHTILFGSSYAGGVVAKALERYADDLDGTPNYDGALVHSGIMAGVANYFGYW